MKNIKKVVLYSEGFKPKDEIVSFAKSLGYDNIKDLRCRMDKKFIDFIKEHIGTYIHPNNYKESVSSKKAHTDKEFAYITTVDTNKKWCIMHNAIKGASLPKHYEDVVYVNIYQQEHNYVEINLC